MHKTRVDGVFDQARIVWMLAPEHEPLGPDLGRDQSARGHRMDEDWCHAYPMVTGKPAEAAIPEKGLPTFVVTSRARQPTLARDRVRDSGWLTEAARRSDTRSRSRRTAASHEASLIRVAAPLTLRHALDIRSVVLRDCHTEAEYR